MKMVDANEFLFEEFELFGKPVLFTDHRVDSLTVPKGFYKSEIRHSSIDDMRPVSVEKLVVVNFFGTVISREPIGFRMIGDDDWGFTGGQCYIRDWMKGETLND